MTRTLQRWAVGFIATLALAGVTDGALAESPTPLSIGASAQTPRLLRFRDKETLVAVRLAIEGAAVRLAHPGCQDLFADFADESGQVLATKLVAIRKSPADAFGLLRFHDDRGAPQCWGRRALAFTEAGSWLIRLCGEEFRRAFQRNRTATEIIVIHEFLHALGLGENPPTSQAITAQVSLRCGD
jgi:hypothetical protein